FALFSCLVVGTPVIAAAQSTPPQQSTNPPVTQAVVVSCESRGTERKSCPAHTSRVVILVRSLGKNACLLGKTWGYDDKNIWVQDGCSGEFVIGRAPEATENKSAA